MLAYLGYEGSADLMHAMLASSSQARASMTAPHPWNGQTTLDVAAHVNHLEMLLEAEGSSPSLVHAGNGALHRGSLHEARDAYRSAILLTPTSAAAYLRLGAVQTRERPGSVDSAETFRAAWRLHPHGHADEDDFVRARQSMALAGFEDRIRAQTLAQLSVDWDPDAPDAVRRAVGLWRQQGVVVFPSVLNDTVIQALRQSALDTLRDPRRVDLSTSLRESGNRGSLRTFKAMPMTRSRGALASLAMVLAPFFAEALQLPALVAELGVLRTASGAEAQELHRDDRESDGRLAAVQISLVDTRRGQGVLEVQPASHAAKGSRTGSRGERGIALALPRGSVVVYRLDVRHRGGAHTLQEDRLIASLTVLGAHALVPYGVPFVVQPADAGRWWIDVGGRVVDRTSDPEAVGGS